MADTRRDTIPDWNPFDTARRIAKCYAEGQYRKSAMRDVDTDEHNYNLGMMQRLALTGLMAIEALGADPDQTSPDDVRRLITELHCGNESIGHEDPDHTGHCIKCGKYLNY